MAQPATLRRRAAAAWAGASGLGSRKHRAAAAAGGSRISWAAPQARATRSALLVGHRARLVRVALTHRERPTCDGRGASDRLAALLALEESPSRARQAEDSAEARARITRLVAENPTWGVRPVADEPKTPAISMVCTVPAVVLRPIHRCCGWLQPMVQSPGQGPIRPRSLSSKSTLGEQLG